MREELAAPPPAGHQAHVQVDSKALAAVVVEASGLGRKAAFGALGFSGERPERPRGQAPARPHERLCPGEGRDLQ